MAEQENAVGTVPESTRGDISLAKGNEPAPSVVYSEKGVPAIVTFSDRVFEDCQHELRWPEAGHTFNKMLKDGAIAPAVSFFKMLMLRAKWNVKIPAGYEDVLKDKAKFLKQQMDDMDHPWMDFIGDAATFFPYGFAVCEKVFRERRTKNGSRYDDGLVGIKRLPLRPQDSICDWVWENGGRDLRGLNQEAIVPANVNNLNNSFAYQNTIDQADKIFIPRKKFLLFRNRGNNNSPYGESPLVGCWQAWKYKQGYQENEAFSAAQDSHGFKVLYLPARYLDPKATDEDKLVFEEYKKIMSNISVAKQSGLILPLVVDDNGKKQFEFTIENLTGKAINDVDAIVKRYTSEILVSLFSDFLSLGTQGGGSFSLADTKVSIVQMAVESKLNEIKAQLNNDLIPQLFALNGWDSEVTPYFDYGGLGNESLDELGKFVQRTKAVGAFPVVPETINWLMEQADINYRVDPDATTDDIVSQTGEDTSRSGDGMASDTGGLNGTGNTVSNDNSTLNPENAE